MAAKHRYRRPSRHPHFVAAIGGAALGIAGIGAYTAIADSSAPAPVAQQAPAPAPAVDAAPTAHVVEQGTVVAISDSVLTTRDVTGSTVDYVITPGTTSVTPQGSGPVPLQFAIGDVVSIHATVTDDTSVATAVADSAIANLQGPPMDSIDPSIATVNHPISG